MIRPEDVVIPSSVSEFYHDAYRRSAVRAHEIADMLGPEWRPRVCRRQPPHGEAWRGGICVRDDTLGARCGHPGRYYASYVVWDPTASGSVGRSIVASAYGTSPQEALEGMTSRLVAWEQVLNKAVVAAVKALPGGGS